MARHDASEGLDFSDDIGEAEVVDLRADFFGVFVSDGRFAEIGFSIEPAHINVAGVVFDEILSMIGGRVKSL